MTAPQPPPASPAQAVPRSDDGPPSAACGRCGYPLRGLPSFICPECGADLREVGMIQPGTTKGGASGRAGRYALIVAWTAVVSLVAVALLNGLPDMLGVRGSPKNGVIALILAFSLLAWVAGALFVFRRRAVAPLTAAPAVRPPAHGATRSRTLTVLFADIEGYAALTAGSSRRELEALLEDAASVVRRATEPRGGRLVKTLGDGFIVAFDSPTDAVLAGRDVLARAATGGTRMRVGVASGEVTVRDDGDVLGDAVNVAARLQAVATDGRVCFAESTYHTMNRTEIPHEEVGVIDLKNIGPTRVFRTRDA